jgi:hypothetical protein
MAFRSADDDIGGLNAYKKFTDFLKHQRWQISEAENKRRSEERERERTR